jgi:hypothetical protein
VRLRKRRSNKTPLTVLSCIIDTVGVSLFGRLEHVGACFEEKNVVDVEDCLQSVSLRQ